MVSRFENRLTGLNRAELEQVASVALIGLMDARSANSAREKQDDIILAFVAGTTLASLACFIGLVLH